MVFLPGWQQPSHQDEEGRSGGGGNRTLGHEWAPVFKTGSGNHHLNLLHRRYRSQDSTRPRRDSRPPQGDRAEKGGIEPPVTEWTPAFHTGMRLGQRSQLLQVEFLRFEHLSVNEYERKRAEMEGFEPSRDSAPTGLANQPLRPPEDISIRIHVPS